MHFNLFTNTNKIQNNFQFLFIVHKGQFYLCEIDKEVYKIELKYN